MSSPRVHWSVMPDLTTSVYIAAIVSGLQSREVDVRRMSLRALARSSGELVHIQWPEHVSGAPSSVRRALKGARSLALIAAIRARRHRVILTAHNLEPHFPSNTVDRTFRRAIERLAERIVVMAPGQTAELEADGLQDLDARAVLIRHPVSAPQNAVVARPDGALLLLGIIASYHRPCELVEALISSGSTRTVVVVGSVGEPETLARLQRLEDKHAWLSVRPGYMDDDELSNLLQSTVAVVALQRRPFNSGAPFFAFPHGLPVVLTESALADDLKNLVGDEWVHSVPLDPLTMDVDALERFLREPRQEIDLSALAPELIAEQHVQMYEALAQTDTAAEGTPGTPR